jgi:predicted GIY-YIG superfamily endonuclease
VSQPKRYVYVLRSRPDPARYYTGVTSDWRARLEAHNAGRCPHTSTGRPWEIDVIVRVADERRALAFEHYVKSGSGAAFAMSISGDDVDKPRGRGSLFAASRTADSAAILD